MVDDKISTLPDDVLCHILSFLPTEKVVSTMILSKRWEKLWLSVPVLDLGGRHLTEANRYSRFVNFVYAVIVERSVIQPLVKRFRLICNALNEDHHLSYSDFKIWVNAAVNHGVEHLDFYMSFQTKLPCCVFSCRTLVVLELNKFRVNGFVSADLPSLKTLYLTSVEFSEPRYLTELLNACPVLEDLDLFDVHFDIDSVTGELKTLQWLISASICNTSHFNTSLESFCNAKFLKFIREYDLPIPVFRNLTHLILPYDEAWHKVFEILKHSPNLQILEFRLPDSVEVYDDEDEVFMRSLPLVAERVTLQLRECTLTGYTGVECELLFAKYILLNSKFLQTMRIWRISNSTPEEELEMLKELSTFPRSSANVNFCLVDD